jgi:putative membrane protein
MHYLIVMLKGMAYGVTHIVPGLGGGLILILLGIYGQFVDAVGNFFTDLRGWRKRVQFLVPLGIGMVIGMLLLARLITLFLNRFPAATMVFFMGLLLGTIPSVLKMHEDMRPTVGRALALILGLAMVVLLKMAQPVSMMGSSIASLSSPGGLLYNLLVSLLAGGASVTPGLDGSYILLLGGTYNPVVAAFADLTHLVIHWGLLITTGLGAVAGILGFSKLIDTAIRRAPAVAYYVVLGLIIGSVYGLWPTQPAQVGPVFLGLSFVLGLGVALLLGKPTPDA